MNTSLVAERYAAALFQLAIEKNLVEELFSDNLLIVKTSESSHELRLLLKSPIINSGKKLAIVKAVFTNKVHALTLSYLEIMTRKRREGYLQPVAREFIEIYNQYKNILTVHFKSPVPPDEKTRLQVIELMKKYSGANIDLQSDIDESLIGGFVLRWQDKQYDASIRREIENMRSAIAKVNLYKKEF
jgi:F-type H+-transporting ATPase subunit delta